MHVMISGAGIAGPALAWFLAKAGARITVVEKAPSLLPYGQNIDVHGTAITVLKKMGVMDEIRRLNTTEKGTQFINASGKPFAAFPVNKGYTASLTVETEILRGDLSAVLYSASKDNRNVKYLFGTTIDRVLSNQHESVQVELSNGETHEMDLLVAADGQRSKVRQHCFPPESVHILDKDMYAAYCTIPRLPSDNEWWNIYFGLGSKNITIRPDPHGTVRAMFTLMPRNDVQRKAWIEASASGRKEQKDLVRREFDDVGWQARRILDAMEQAPDFYLQAVQQIKLSKWSTSRVVCLGDAAYAPTPLTGAGSSLAIIGAYVLAGELSKLDDGEHPSRALEAYERTFRPFVEEQQQILSPFPGIAHPDTPLKRWLLHTLLWIVSKIVMIPWAAKSFGGIEEEDFALPQYSCFDGDNSK